MTNTNLSRLSKKILSSLFMVFVTLSSLAPAVHAKTTIPLSVRLADVVNVLTDPTFSVPNKRLSAASKDSLYTVDTTAYTSTPEECDDTPFTTADGSHVRDGIVAANFLPFGTKVRIPELFGNKIFEVHDRMNARFNDRSKYLPRVDVWMDNKQDMREYGIHRKIKLEVVEMGDGTTQWNKNKPVAIATH